ncbi:hypothetical protein ACFE04_028498 [Oxalis oulophora]
MAGIIQSRYYSIAGLELANLVSPKLRRWCPSGVPRFHACTSIFKNKKDPKNYVHPLLSKNSYLVTYSHKLQPIVGMLEWPKTNHPDEYGMKITEKQLGHNKLSCPDRPNPTEKPHRKLRTKKTTNQGTSSQLARKTPTDVTDQPPRMRRTRNTADQCTSS